MLSLADACRGASWSRNAAAGGLQAFGRFELLFTLYLDFVYVYWYVYARSSRSHDLFRRTEIAAIFSKERSLSSKAKTKPFRVLLIAITRISAPPR